jgi:mono/diheme cytochrome c family protein
MKRVITALFAVALATSAFADGAATYKAKCAACHGADAKGAKMAPKPIAGMPEAKVKSAIEKGVTGEKKMPPVKLEAADTDAVAKYVAGLK